MASWSTRYLAIGGCRLVKGPLSVTGVKQTRGVVVKAVVSLRSLVVVQLSQPTNASPGEDKKGEKRRRGGGRGDGRIDRKRDKAEKEEEAFEMGEGRGIIRRA